MGRRKLSEEERIKSREKRLEYLRNYRKEHGPEYYKENKERILKHQRAKREQEKGSPLNSHNKINLKDMTKEERNEYYKIKNRESRARKREEFIYVLPEIEVILPSEKIKGVQSVKIKLKNSAKKEILIYPISIDFKDNLLYIALSADKAKMVQDGKEFLMNGKENIVMDMNGIMQTSMKIQSY